MTQHGAQNGAKQVTQQVTPHREVLEARDFVQSRLSARPRVGVVLGSGFGEVARQFDGAEEIAYAQIPYWPASVAGQGIPGHGGVWISTAVDDVPVAVLSGRAHLYEGFSAAEIAFPVRVLASLGVDALVLTNASGSLHEQWKPGCLALISDHIHLQGANPLSGPNEDRWGPRFPDLSDAYSAQLRRLAREAAAELEIGLHEGVYAAVAGPNYETPAEIRFLRTIGADMVGMSTTGETIAARHMGVPVLGLSLITNLAAGISVRPLSHEEVLESGRRGAPMLFALLKKLIPRVANQGRK